MELKHTIDTSNVDITFTLPDTTDRFHIVRKTRAYPRTIVDGIMVAEDLHPLAGVLELDFNLSAITGASATLWGGDGAGGERTSGTDITYPRVYRDSVEDEWEATTCAISYGGTDYNVVGGQSDNKYCQFINEDIGGAGGSIGVGAESADAYNEPQEIPNMVSDNIDAFLVTAAVGFYFTGLFRRDHRAAVLAYIIGQGWTVDLEIQGVFTVPAGDRTLTIEDDDPVRPYINYYTLFIRSNIDGSWTQEIAKIPVWDHYDFTDIMYLRLPEDYHGRDRQQSPSEPLLRFLKLPGYNLEVARHSLESLIRNKNPYEIDSDWLTALGWDVGWITNVELPILRQRAEIARAVYAYTRKGTKAGLEAMIRGVINWDVEIIDPSYNILFRNRWKAGDARYSSGRMDFDPAVILRMGTVDDTVDYRPGSLWNPRNIQVILTATTEFDIFNEVIHKLLRIFDYWVPINTDVTILIRFEFDPEIFAVGDWRPTNPCALVSNWLVRNQQPTTPNPNKFELYGYRTRTNSLWRRPKS